MISRCIFMMLHQSYYVHERWRLQKINRKNININRKMFQTVHLIFLVWLKKSSRVWSGIFEIPVLMGKPDSKDLKVRNVLKLSKHSPVVWWKSVVNAGTSNNAHSPRWNWRGVRCSRQSAALLQRTARWCVSMSCRTTAVCESSSGRMRGREIMRKCKTLVERRIELKDETNKKKLLQQRRCRWGWQRRTHNSWVSSPRRPEWPETCSIRSPAAGSENSRQTVGLWEHNWGKNCERQRQEEETTLGPLLIRFRLDQGRLA